MFTLEKKEERNGIIQCGNKLGEMKGIPKIKNVDGTGFQLNLLAFL